MTLKLHSWEDALLIKANESYHAIPNANIEDKALLAKAYHHCKELTSFHSKSFYMASELLPSAEKEAVRALYAFCRVTDDIVDESLHDVIVKLAQWRHKVLGGSVSADDLVAIAWADARTKYHIPARYITQLIDGVARDLEQNRYATFADLAAYSYGVASTVGLMSMHIIGYEDEAAVPYAIKLGVALQMTNILRDVGEDWGKGRLYLPQDELAQFGIDESYFEAGRVDDRWRSFMRYQVERTHALYEEAKPGIFMLRRQGRFSIAAAADLYRAILTDIEANDYDVFSRRAHLSAWQKLRRLPALWWQTR